MGRVSDLAQGLARLPEASKLLAAKRNATEARFLSGFLIIRAPFFLLFGFNKGTQKEKKAKRALPRSLGGDTSNHVASRVTERTLESP